MFSSLAQPLTALVDAGFHVYIHETILADPVINNRKAMARVYGNQIVSTLIKQKKYRKEITDFID
jgi:hypothetical protein